MQRGKEIGRGYVLRLVTTERQAGHAASVWVDSGPGYWVPPELAAASRDEATHICELQVPWEFGVGHPDLFIPETGTIVEVLSAATAGDSYRRGKLLQAVGYCEHYEPARNVALIVVSPSDYTEDRTVVAGHTDLYRGLVDEMQARVAQVRAWAEEGTLPDRVCAKPSEARSHFCQHAAHCFEGWEPPPLPVIAADAALVLAAQEFDAVKRERAAGARLDREQEQRQKAAQAVLEAAELPAGMDVMVGGYKVTRTAVQRKPVFDWEKAEAAGVFEPGLYDGYFRPGSAYSTFKVALVGDAPGEDYGDIPF